MGCFDDEPVARTNFPIQIEMHVFCQSAISHAVYISRISLAIGTTSQGISLHREFLSPVCHISIQHSIAVGTTCQCHLAIGLDVFAIIDVNHTFCASHCFCHRTVATNLDMVYLTSLHIG